MVVTYKVNTKVEPHQLAELFRASGLRRPVEDLNRIKKMIDNANLLVTAWEGSRLVGVARAITDYSYCCYLSDLAIAREFQYNGIGQDLVTEVKKQVGDECMLLLLSSPEAMNYYPKIGFDRTENAFIINRKK